MKRHILTSAVLAAIVLVSGCSSMKNPLYGDNAVIRDRGQDYEKAQAAPRLDLPSDVQARQMNEQLVVPDIGKTTTASAKAFEVPRPEFFYADAGSDTVNLKRVGDQKVIVVDEPIASVWQKLKDFWQFNNIELAKSDPRQGTMESGWIRVDGEHYSFADRWIKKLTFQDIQGPTRNKLRITVRPDPQDYQRTSIRMDHVVYPWDQQVAQVDWNKDAHDVGYKSDMMFEMLRYLSKATAEPSAQSLVAMQQHEDIHPLLGHDARGNPLLKIEAPIDRAWTLVSHALDAAKIDVGTRDQKQGVFYITYTSRTPMSEKKKVGFFEWLNGDRGDIKLNTDVLESSLGLNSGADKQKISYSSKNATQATGDALDRNDLADPNNPANKEGYKIWFAGKVIYVFGSDNKQGVLNRDTGNYEYVGKYQLHMNRTRTGSYLSVLTDQGLDAPATVAQEILWSLKAKLPTG